MEVRLGVRPTSLDHQAIARLEGDRRLRRVGRHRRRKRIRGTEEDDETAVAKAMKRILPVLLLCAACNTLPTTPATEAPGATAGLHVQVVRLEHTQATEMAQVVEEVMATRPTSRDDLRVAAQPDQNALVLSGTTEQIRNALELVARLDVKPAR